MSEIMFVIYMCYIPIVSSFFPRISFIDINTTWVFFYILFLVFLIDSIKRRGIKINSPWLFIILTFSLYSFMAISWSKYSYDIPILKEFFMGRFVPLAVLIMALNILQKESSFDMFIKNQIIAAWILSIIAIYQMLTGYHNRIIDDMGFRSVATFSNANSLAIFLVLSISCLLYAIGRRIIPVYVGILSIFVIISGIVCTVSRKGITTAVFTLLIYNILKMRIKTLLVIIFLLIVGIVALTGFETISHRFALKTLQTQAVAKSNMSAIGLKMFKQSPIIGLGHRGYYENVGKYIHIWWAKKFDAHNIYVTVLTDYGIIGFIFFMLIFIYPLFKTVRVLTKRSIYIQPERKDAAVICISCMLPFMVSIYFAGGMLDQYPLWALLYTEIGYFLTVMDGKQLIPSYLA